MNVETWLEKQTILKVYRGSHSYGTNNETSDVDLGGVCIPPVDCLLGLQWFEQWGSKTYTTYPAYNKKRQPADYVVFSLSKFVQLASNCNPNVLEYLFNDTTNIVFSNDYGNLLLENRNLFLTTRARHTFGGYAYSQLHRLTNKLPMEEFKERLVKLEAKKLETEKFIFRQESKVIRAKAELTNIESDTDAEEHRLELIHIYESGISGMKGQLNVIEQDIEKITEAIGGGNHNHHGSHSEIIEKHGYDTKHAMHLIRLLHMGLEILKSGECIVLRPDNNYLMDIRNGKYTLDEIKIEAEKLFGLLDEAYVNSKLPAAPDTKAINDLLVYLHLKSIRGE